MVRGLAILGLGILLVGCGPRESAVVGHWKGHALLSKEDQKAPLSNLADAFAASVTLDIKADHTFKMMAFIMPVEGNWSMTGSRLTLKPTKAFGFDAPSSKSTMGSTKGQGSLDQDMVLNLTSDGKTLNPAKGTTNTTSGPEFSFEKDTSS